MKKYKRLLLMAGIVGLAVVLSGCGTGEVSAQSTGIWGSLHRLLFCRSDQGIVIW